MAEKFNLIFGSDAPDTTSWSDADYQTGWATVGSTPPTAEQFNFLQNRADLKAKELKDTIDPLVQKATEEGRQPSTAYALEDTVTADGIPTAWFLECTTAGTTGSGAITIPSPLTVGGTITDGTVVWTVRKCLPTSGGTLIGSNLEFNRDVDNGTMLFTGGTGVGGRFGADGPNAPLREGKTGTAFLGSIDLTSGTEILVHKDEVIIHTYEEGVYSNTYNIMASAVVASSFGTNSYIKRADGTIIQWGETGSISAATTIYFPISFGTGNYKIVATPDASSPAYASFDSGNYTSIKIHPSAAGNYKWIAIGHA